MDKGHHGPTMRKAGTTPVTQRKANVLQDAPQAPTSHQQQQQDDLAELRVPLQSIKLHHHIGTGGFCAAYSATVHGETQVAKVPHKFGGLTEQEIEELLQEVRIHARLRSTHVAQFLGVCHEGRAMALLMEHAPYGSLQQLLDNLRKNNQQAPPHVLSYILKDALAGLMYLHVHDIVHRDIKPDNILLFSNFHAKLCDMGLAKQQEATLQAGSFAGTLRFMAPEMRSGQPVGKHLDVYAFGVSVCMTMHQGLANFSLDDYVLPDPVVQWPNGHAVVPSMQEFIVHCVQENPLDRPLVEDALNQWTAVCDLWGTDPRAIHASAEDVQMMTSLLRQQHLCLSEHQRDIMWAESSVQPFAEASLSDARGTHGVATTAVQQAVGAQVGGTASQETATASQASLASESAATVEASSTTTSADTNIGSAILPPPVPEMQEDLDAGLTLEELIERDRQALIDLYNECGGTSWRWSPFKIEHLPGQHHNWLSDRPLSEWYGITLHEDDSQDAGRVMKVDLSMWDLNLRDRDKEMEWIDLGVSGVLPDSIGNLTALKRINFKLNRGLAGLPHSVGSWRQICLVNLDKTSVAEIPTSAAQWPAAARLTVCDAFVSECPPFLRHLDGVRV